MNCWNCGEEAGFHKGVCYEYSAVSVDLAGPSSSKEFMVWLKDRNEKAREAKKKADFLLLKNV